MTMADTSAGEDTEVLRLRNLVKDLEQQNTVLRSQKLAKTTNSFSDTGQGLDTSSRSAISLSSDDGDEDFLDLSSACALDDDVSWLYISPSKYKPNIVNRSSELLKKNTLSVFETPEILPVRRALSHKLRDIERARSTPMTNYALSPGSGVTSPEGGRVSLNGSYTSDPGYNSANNTSSNHYSDHEGSYSNGASSNNHGEYMTSGTGALKASPILSDDPAHLPADPAHLHLSSPASAHQAYNTGTFTRPKKKPIIVSSHIPASSVAINSDSDAELPALDSDSDDNDIINNDAAGVMEVNIQPPTPTSHIPPSTQSKNIGDMGIDETTKYLKNMGAGDSSTFVRRPRNQTRTIEASAILEAQRSLSDSPQSVEHSENDSLSALPDATFKRRPASGHNQDKSKRESLDIQTLAKMQEQSLRDSLEAVRKASIGSAGSGGVPALGIKDLDSSNSSIASSTDDYHQHAEEKANQGSGTFRIRRSPRQSSSPSPTLELNGDTPIIHKPLVTPGGAGTGRKSPQIRSSLSPRSLQSPRASGLQKPRSSLPAPVSKLKPRSGGIPTPRSSGLRPPSSTPYSSR